MKPIFTPEKVVLFGGTERRRRACVGRLDKSMKYLMKNEPEDVLVHNTRLTEIARMPVINFSLIYTERLPIEIIGALTSFYE